MIYTAFYYLFFASAVILYGVGLNSATIVCDKIHELAFPLIKVFTGIITASVLSWLIITNLLIPLDLAELYPLVALLVFIIVSIFIETLIRITTGKVTSEFSLSFLMIVLALNESLDILDVLLISCCSFVSYIILIPILYSIKKRLDTTGNIRLHGNKKSLVLVSIAIIVVILAVGNVSWLNNRVLP